MSIEKNEIVLPAPKSVTILVVQIMSAAPFGTAFALTLAPFLSERPIKSSDTTILFFFILFFLVIGIALIYFPQKYRTSCIFDKSNNLLRKVKKKKDVLICDLNSVNNVLLRIRKEDLGVRIEVLLEKANATIELYCEKQFWDHRQWIAFAKKLSKATSLPLKEDF